MGRGTDYLPLGYFLAQREGEEARRGLIGPRPKVEVRVERELERRFLQTDPATWQMVVKMLKVEGVVRPFVRIQDTRDVNYTLEEEEEEGEEGEKNDSDNRGEIEVLGSRDWMRRPRKFCCHSTSPGRPGRPGRRSKKLT